MATTTFTTMIPTPSKSVVAKRPGPPVPPRPLPSSLLRQQRDNAGNTTTTTQVQRSASKVGLEQPQQPQILKKPAPTIATTANGNSTTSTTTGVAAAATVAASGGRTVIYKSPSLNLQKRQEEREKQQRSSESQSIPTTTTTTTKVTTTTSSKANAVTQTTTKLTTNGTQAPKPPLKLRKAPDVPTSKPRIQTPTEAAHNASTTSNDNSSNNNNNNNNNIVIVQSSQGVVTLNRHHSMNTPSHNKSPSSLKETRLSLGRADFERVGHKINLHQLQPTSQPLPRPRKIVKIPVATMDMDDTNSNSSKTTSSTSASSAASHSTSTLGVNLFKRSKTTLDNFTVRSHITTVTTGHTTGSYLSGKTVEIKNNLKNAAERLFSEIMVNQQKNGSGSETNGLTNTYITKHERAIQHQAAQTVGGGETGTSDHRSPAFQQRQQPPPPPSQQHSVTVVNTNNQQQDGRTLQFNDNCTRINITATNMLAAKPPIPTTNQNGQQTKQQQEQHVGQRQVVSAYNSPEKKSAAFHEMLISELAAMRTRSCSMENLQTKPQHQQQLQQYTATAETTHFKPPETKPAKAKKKKHDEQSIPDDDIDADNIEDADGDDDGDDDNNIEHVLKKSLKVITASAQNTPRKRTPSGCSSDSSPYGTERSSRIRTSDWIEVGDNGKQVTLTSCHISLEDSGLEDEERMDEMSSSGVGDSWDSVKEAEQHQHQQQQAKRSRSVKRIMSINDLPPLPKSLSGINKMLTSDSGLISDVDTEMAKNAKNNEIKQMESQKENNNNNNIIKDTGDNKLTKATAITATAASAASASASVNETSTAATATTTTTTPLKEINGNETISEIPPAIPGSRLDNQIATLRKEMFGLRQLDLSLLSQLWALNDSIQEFRTMIQENDQEDDETYSTHSRSPSPYDSVSSDADDEISALKGNNLLELKNANANVITTQPKLTKSYSPETEADMEIETNQFTTTSTTSFNRSTSSSDTATFREQNSHLIKPPLPKPLDVKPVPRMRSAPPPPPTHRKSQNAPPRPT